MSNDIIQDLTVIEKIKKLWPLAYSRLSKQNKQDLIDYIKNSNDVHHNNMLWHLAELDYQDDHAVKRLLRWALDVESKRYYKKHLVFFEKYEAFKQYKLKLKPYYNTIDYNPDTNEFKRISFVFQTLSLQFITVDYKTLAEICGDLDINNILDWTLFDIEFSPSETSSEFQLFLRLKKIREI